MLQDEREVKTFLDKTKSQESRNIRSSLREMSKGAVSKSRRVTATIKMHKTPQNEWKCNGERGI